MAAVLHTVFFAVFVPLALYAQNSSEVAAVDVIAPLLAVVGANAVAHLVIRAARADRQRASILVSVAWVTFFLFIPATQWTGWRIRYVLLCVVVLGIGAVLLARRSSKESVHRVTQALAVLGGLLLVNPLRVALLELWSHATQSASERVSPDAHGGATGARRPDIYYLILDGYTSDRALRAFFAFDNSAFTDALTRRGFYVANDSRSNYASTINSIATSLNMEYASVHGDDNPVRMRRRIHNSAVFRELKRQGYHISFITMSSHLRPDLAAPLIDRQTAFGGISDLPQYQMTLVSMTPLRLILVLADRMKLRFGGRFDRDGKLWRPEGIDWVLDKMTQPHRPPSFAFVHVLSPHSPYYHDKDCNVIPSHAETSWNDYSRAFPVYRDAYRAQIQCVNTKVLAALDTLLARPGGSDAVIVIQGDHGAPEIVDASLREQDPAIDVAAFRFSILNAYRYPAAARSLLYQGISPVNSFRVLLASLFDLDLPLRPDRSYWVIDGRHVAADSVTLPPAARPGSPPSQ